MKWWNKLHKIWVERKWWQWSDDDDADNDDDADDDVDNDDDDCGTNRLKMILWQNCAGTPRWQMPQDEWGGDFAFILWNACLCDSQTFTFT